MRGVNDIRMEARMDIFFLGGIALFLARMVGLAHGCKRLGGGLP